MAEPVGLESLNAAHFAAHLGSPFTLSLLDQEPLTLTLQEVTPLGREMPQRRQAFSLVFTGPKVPPLPQNIYTLSHERMGTLEIFLVPIGETALERHYEAIFN